MAETERANLDPPAGDADEPESVSQPVIRVLIVDDHALVRQGTAQLLDQEADLKVVGEAGSGEEGLRLFSDLRPDVTLVDVNLPEMSGLELARRAIAREPKARLLVVSAYDDYAYVAEALDVGVSGYVLKTASAKELVDAVRAVADEVFVLDSAVASRLARRQRDVRAGTPGAEGLTPREREVLGLLVRGQANKQIAAELGLGLRTVESHVSNVLAKLGVVSRTEAVLYALEHHLTPSDDGRTSARPR